MVLCMTLTASLVAYPDIHVIRRKFGLAYTAICFIGFAVLPGESITFPLRFGVSAVLGTQCAVIAMLLPAPLQATSLVKDRAELAARSLAALLSTQLGAFCNTDARSLAKAKTQAGMLRRAVLDNVQSMKEREEELWWEFAGGKPTAKLKRILKVSTVSYALGFQNYLNGSNVSEWHSIDIRLPSFATYRRENAGLCRDSLRHVRWKISLEGRRIVICSECIHFETLADSVNSQSKSVPNAKASLLLHTPGQIWSGSLASHSGRLHLFRRCLTRCWCIRRRSTWRFRVAISTSRRRCCSTS